MAHGNKRTYPINNKSIFEDLYYVKKLSYKEIAKLYGISYDTVLRRSQEHKIKARPFSTKGRKFPNQNTPERLQSMKEGRIHSDKWRNSLLGKPRPDMQGDKHWSWKGGVTSENTKQRRRFQKVIQKRVFERDDYTCQVCNVKGGNLQVDHIQSWAEYIELRFNINNCRTVCAKCHYEITYGKPMPREVKAWGHNLLKGEINL